MVVEVVVEQHLVDEAGVAVLRTQGLTELRVRVVPVLFGDRIAEREVPLEVVVLLLDLVEVIDIEARGTSERRTRR